jgi:hypothetical protein
LSKISELNTKTNDQWSLQKADIQTEHLNSGFLFRKELFEHTIGLSKLAFREDTITSYKLAKKGKLIIAHKAIAYHLNSKGGNRDINTDRNAMAANDEQILGGVLHEK